MFYIMHVVQKQTSNNHQTLKKKKKKKKILQVNEFKREQDTSFLTINITHTDSSSQMNYHFSEIITPIIYSIHQINSKTS